ncbi:MAG: hypothetical protein WCJ02_12910 [bacterium]
MIRTKTWIAVFVCVLVSSAVVAEGPASSVLAKTNEVIVNFGESLGKFRPLNGVNNGPARLGMQQADLVARHKEAGFSSVRLHDCYWPNPTVVDVPAIFPLFHADADDPKNYVFAPTDRYLEPIAARGVPMVYRLGVSIEHMTAFHTQPPEDYEKWAKICVNIIRHYNDGWANGKRWGIKYFEIWNEPDIGKMMWTGTPQHYFELYKVSVKALKAYNPELKIGNQFANGTGKYARPFLAYCREQKLPLDFFSWHRYASRPSDFVRTAFGMRSLLDTNGFNQAESFCTEWKPMLAGFQNVSWNPKSPAGSVEQAFERNRNHEAAACAASTLIRWQDAPLDMAHYYSADYSPWSMFNEYGEPGKVFFAFKAFHQLLETSNRVSVVGLPDADAVTLGAGISDDKKTAALLVSNYRCKQSQHSILLKNLPWSGKPRIEAWQIDATHELQPMDKVDFDPATSILKLDIPESTVLFIRLSP